MLAIRDNSARARTVRLINIFQVLAYIIMLFILCWREWILVGFKQGHIQHPDQELVQINYFTIIMSVISTFSGVLSMIYYICWLRRGYFNLHQIPGSSPSFSDGWAAGAWFVPILNFVRPYQILKEVWEGTQKAIMHQLDKVQSSVIVGWWWALYVFTFIYGLIFFLPFDEQGVDKWINLTGLDIFGHLLAITGILFSNYIIKQAQYLQDKLYEESLKPDESVFSYLPV